MKFHRIPEGWVDPTGRAVISDNGGGFGPAAGSGRWAVTIDERWIANIDTLVEAKSVVAERLAALEQS